MKKTKITIGLMTALLSVGALSGCDTDYLKYSPEGTLVSYTIKDEEGNNTITADQIFAEYYNDSDKYQSIFDAIKSIIVKNYFNVEPYIEKVKFNGKDVELGHPQLKELETEAQKKVDNDKLTAKNNADSKSTLYKDEFDSILESKGVDTEKELFDQYLDELKVAKFDENYYKYFVEELKNGYKAAEGASDEEKELENIWKGYFKEMLPYHVSHILVKLEDSSNSNYHNGTISEGDVDKLMNVIDDLTGGVKTFQMTAYDRSEDGSSKNYGDLGIMDYSTSFVNEFKLGIYAYENLYGNKAKAAESDISLGKTDYESEYKSAVAELYNDKLNTVKSEAPTIDIKVFKELRKVKHQTLSGESEQIMDNSSLVYPRNVIYNQYLNKHSFAFITDSTVTENSITEASDEGKVGYYNIDGVGYVLSTVVAKKVQPILVVRAGTSDYQGIHFIVINRDPFTEEDGNGVSMSDYYTTYYESQELYPKDGSGNPCQTYVNFNKMSVTDQPSRADSLNSTLKSFSSDRLSKFIFLKYMAKENIKLTDETLDAQLKRWIKTSISSKTRERDDAWDNIWNEYVSTLRKENDARTSLMPQVARIGFDNLLTDALSVEKVIQSLTAYASDLGITLPTLEGLVDKTEDEVKDDEATYAAWKILKSVEETLAKNSSATLADLYNMKGALCNDGKTHK